jgi:hypothetical protein
MATLERIAMTQFPENEHINDASAQAFIDENDPSHGHVRFEAAGTIRIYRLPLSAFSRLARDIQSAMRQSSQSNPPQFPANDQ